MHLKLIVTFPWSATAWRASMSLTTAYRIVLADDHILFRKELKSVLEEDAELEVVGEAGDGLELIALLKEITPHMVILDLSMPNMDGFETAREIKKKCPDIDILILTMHKEDEYAFQAKSAGARGYVVKDNVDTELFDAIKAIREGGVYFPLWAGRKVLNSVESWGTLSEGSQM